MPREIFMGDGSQIGSEEAGVQVIKQEPFVKELKSTTPVVQAPNERPTVTAKPDLSVGVNITPELAERVRQVGGLDPEALARGMAEASARRPEEIKVSGERSGRGSLENIDPQIRERIIQAEKAEAEGRAEAFGTIFVLNETKAGKLEITRERNGDGQAVYYICDKKLGLKAGIIPGGDFQAENYVPEPGKPFIEAVHAPTGGMTSETLTVGTERVDIEFPVDPDERIDWMRSFLQDVEIFEQDFQKDPIVSRRMNEIYAVIIHLLRDTPPGSPGREKAEKMHKEFYGRLQFQSVVNAFGNANDIKEVHGAVSQISGDHLQIFFHQPEFIYALNYYEMNGQNFTNRLGGTVTASEAQENFRKAAKADLLAKIAAGGTTIGGNPVTLRADNLDWCINRAEKFWTVIGRRITQENAPYDPVNKYYDFEDDSVSKGNTALRKILRFKEWVQSKSEKGNFRVTWDLMDGVDLKEQDYIKELIDKSAAIQQETVARDPAHVGINIAGAVDLTTCAIDPTTGLPILKTGRIDFTQIDWNRVNFTNPWGGTDFDFWAIRKLADPDGARNTLMGKPDSFLRDPNDNSLASLVDAFAYQKEDQYKVKGQLLENYERIMSSDRAKEFGAQPQSKAAAKLRTAILGGKLGLNKEEISQRTRAVIGRGVRTWLAVFSGTYRLKDTIGDGLKEFFMALIKAITSQK